MSKLTIIEINLNKLKITNYEVKFMAGFFSFQMTVSFFYMIGYIIIMNPLFGKYFYKLNFK